MGKNGLGDKAVASVVKRDAEAAGLDPSNYAGRSLRAELATSAVAGGAQQRDIMRQTGYRSVQMLRRYRDNYLGQTQDNGPLSRRDARVPVRA